MLKCMNTRKYVYSLPILVPNCDYYGRWAVHLGIKVFGNRMGFCRRYPWLWSSDTVVSVFTYPTIIFSFVDNMILSSIESIIS